MDMGTYLQSIKEEDSSAAVYSNKNLCEASCASDLVLIKKRKLPQPYMNIFF